MRKYIFDTDLGGDCDDVMALDLLMAADKAGEGKLLGVTYSYIAPLAPGCIRALLRWQGLGLPVGACPAQEGFEDFYSRAVCEAFPKEAEGDTEEAVALLRRLIAGEDRVTLVVTGSLTNMAALLKSAPDEYSPLDGMALVKERVEEFAVMAANFSHQSGMDPLPEAVQPDGSLLPMPEGNVNLDLKATVDFFALCPVKVAVSPFELGYRMITGAPMCRTGAGKTPDSLSYLTHGSVNGQHSWDPATAYYALYGASPWMYKTMPGTVIIDEKGFSHFRVGEGNHVLLYPASSKEAFAAEMDRRVMRLYDK